MIVATLAIAIILAEAARIGADTRDFWLPPLLNSPVALLPFKGAPAITLLQLFNLGSSFCLLQARSWCSRAPLPGASCAPYPMTRWLRHAWAHQTRCTSHSPPYSAAAHWRPFGGMLAVLYFGNMSFGSGLIYALKVLFIASAGGFSCAVGGSFWRICLWRSRSAVGRLHARRLARCHFLFGAGLHSDPQTGKPPERAMKRLPTGSTG